MAKFKTVIVAVNGIQYPDTATPQTLAYFGYATPTGFISGAQLSDTSIQGAKLATPFLRYATPIGQIFGGVATPVGQIFNNYATPTGQIDGGQLAAASIQPAKLATPFLGYATPYNAPLYVSTLPANPVDGQQVYYQSTIKNTGGGREVSMKDSGVVWHLKYNASGDSNYPWEFIGGSGISMAASGGLATPVAQFTYYSYSQATPVHIPLKGSFQIQQIHNTNTQSYSSTAMRYFAVVDPSGAAVGGNSQLTLTPWNFFGTYYIHASAMNSAPVTFTTPTTVELTTAIFNQLPGSYAAVQMTNRSMIITPIKVGRP